MRARSRHISGPDSRDPLRAPPPRRGAYSTKRPPAARPHVHAVLVVDDDAVLCEPLLEILVAEGFRARAVANGQEALGVLRAGFRACVIVLDLTMPVMDGWRFRALQRADERLASIPVVIMTALCDPPAEARKLGAAAAFQKPFEASALLRAIAANCPHRRQG